MIMLGVALIVLGMLIRRFRDKLTNIILVFGFNNSVVSTVTTKSRSDSEKGGGVGGFINILSIVVTLAGIVVGLLPFLKN